MATYTSILAWEIPWREEPGWVTVHGVTKELNTASQLNMCQNPWNHPSSCGLSGKSTGFVIGKLGF